MALAIDALRWIPAMAGRFFAFASHASHLTTDLDGNDAFDTFLFDTATGATVLASEALGGGMTGNDASAPIMISADGSTVVVVSDASDLVAVDTNGTEDVFAFEVPRPEVLPIPALGPPSVVVLAGLLATTGRFVMRRLGG